MVLLGRRMASSEWRRGKRSCFFIHYSLLALLLATRPFQHSSANQRFHMADILVTDFVGDRSDAGRPRHRVAAEKKMVAGADQAGVEHDRIDVAEFAGPNALFQQAAMEIQQGCYK